ncbi:MAG TPA: two-component regulator propeller domain-containing protein [Pyrinomonadaceae bacterium]|nr:two-component regulator propeller domain-containing protein [Pyrinomonadaceae bacterium]
MVFKIRQDSRGFLWFCSAEGISRFDGMGMTNFTIADGLPDRVVNDFLETKSGTIYIATGKGLARLNPHGLRGSMENPLFTVFLPDNPKAEKVLTLYEDKKDQVWVGTNDGLYKLIETGGPMAFEQVPLGDPLGDPLATGGTGYELGPNTLKVNTLLEDRRGTFWIGTYGSGLFRLSQDGSIRRFTVADGFGDNKITDLLEGRDGRLWMSMRSDEKGGVCLLDGEASEQPVTYLITPIGGIGYTATLRLHYLDTELNGNAESTLQLWRNNGANWTPEGVTNRNTTQNWVEYNNVTQFSPWTISGPTAPTAATVGVGGQVKNAFGAGIRNAAITLTALDGSTKTMYTGSFGYYRFNAVRAGETYVLSVSAKRFTFAQSSIVVGVIDEITGLDFVADPQP